MYYVLCELSSCLVRNLTNTRYVQMLEHQNTQLIAGIQELYRRLAEKEPRPDLPIESSCNGQPLTHRILEALNIVRPDEWNGNEHSDDSAVSSTPTDNACGSPLPHGQTTFSIDSSQANNTHHVHPRQEAHRLPVPSELTPPPKLAPLEAGKLTRKPTFTLQMPPPYFACSNNQNTDCFIHGTPDLDWLLETSIGYGEPSVFDPMLQRF